MLAPIADGSPLKLLPESPCSTICPSTCLVERKTTAIGFQAVGSWLLLHDR
jgi:hypothetical protein